MRIKVEHDTEYRRGYIEALLDLYDEMVATSSAGAEKVKEVLARLKGE